MLFGESISNKTDVPGDNSELRQLVLYDCRSTIPSLALEAFLSVSPIPQGRAPQCSESPRGSPDARTDTVRWKRGEEAGTLFE